MHLRYNVWLAIDSGETRHAQEVMNYLGIVYQHATPQSIADQWWFWNCENVPDLLPDYLTPLDLDPQEQVGWGLSQEMADHISTWDGSQDSSPGNQDRPKSQFLDELSLPSPTTVISLRKLVSSAPFAERWVRDDTGEECDIGFAGDYMGAVVDGAAIELFIRGYDGRAIIIYDQTGNGNHWYQKKE